MKTISFLFILLYMISCDDKKPANVEDTSGGYPLEGKWKAVSLFLGDASTGVCHQEKLDREVTVEFIALESNPVQYRMAGQAMVNDYFAGYQLISFDKTTGIGKIKVDGVGGTKRAGRPEMMECELNYYNFLAEATGFQIDPVEPNILKIGRIKPPSEAPSRDGGTYYVYERIK
jgi:hypothetical protein